MMLDSLSGYLTLSLYYPYKRLFSFVEISDKRKILCGNVISATEYVKSLENIFLFYPNYFLYSQKSRIRKILHL